MRFWGMPRGRRDRLDLFFVRPPFAILLIVLLVGALYDVMRTTLAVGSYLLHRSIVI